LAKTYINIINELRERADQASHELIALLKVDSIGYSRARELLEKYEELLSASDLLEHAATNTSHNESENRIQESDIEKPVVISEEEPPLIKEEAMESTAVPKTHLKVVESDVSSNTGLQLAVLDASGRVTEIEIAPQEGECLIIGRTRAKPMPNVGLTIDDRSISSQHCEINWTENKGWVLTDFGTTNGTELNGEPVIGEVCMTKTGEIRLGDSVIKFFPKHQQDKFMETMRLIVEH
jgi:hypothetical protein